MSELQKVAIDMVSQALPAIVGFVVINFQETITLFFIGSLNDSTSIAAIGIGNVIIHIFGTSIFQGVNSAIDTLV